MRDDDHGGEKGEVNKVCTPLPSQVGTDLLTHSPIETRLSACPDASIRILEVLQAISPLGGAVCCNLLVELLRQHTAQPVSILGPWITRRDLSHFVCDGRLCVPRFQIDIANARVRTGVAIVIAELGAILDDLEIVEWFASPNLWLGGAPPATMLHKNAADVVGAARADRFIFRGSARDGHD
ncbi:MAG: hypothetical protein ABI460_02900 [Caldimonas sp.]